MDLHGINFYRKMHTHRGFTLVEIVVTLFIISIVMLIFVKLYSTITKSLIESRLITLASTKAQDKLEELVQIGTDDFNNASFVSGGPIAVSLSNNKYKVNMQWVVDKTISAYASVTVNISCTSNPILFSPIIMKSIVENPNITF